MSNDPVNLDQHMMREALSEGSRGVGLTAPNPAVGAVIMRDGKILGRGFHTGAGQPHAEVEALRDAAARKEDVVGAEIFITLEPCSTTGRTPPCTEAITKAGLRRVVWAAEDPNPAHLGAARRILESAGIEVRSGLLADEAEVLHRGFFKVQRQGLPWVIVKTALSLDGRITRPDEEGQWLTGVEARAQVQELRGEVDAILTSGATARADNPRLNYRGPRSEKPQPLRVVVTREEFAGLPESAHLRADGGKTLFCGGNLEELLRDLARKGCQTVLVEAGGDLVGQFLDEGLVDEWVSYLAPMVCGGPAVGIAGSGTAEISERPRLTRVSYQQVGADICVRGFLEGSALPLG